MAEIRRTSTWIGGTGSNDGPTQLHVHSVAGTPHGDDYGRDLLRKALPHLAAPPVADGPAAGSAPDDSGNPRG